MIKIKNHLQTNMTWDCVTKILQNVTYVNAWQIIGDLFYDEIESREKKTRF